MNQNDEKGLKEKARSRVVELRRMASNDSTVALELFRSIKNDQQCGILLSDYTSATPNRVEAYNEHIRHTRLPKDVKENLII